MFWRGLVGYLPANLVQGIVGLLSIVVFTRLLSPAAYGAYAVAFSAASLAHTLVFTWLEAAMARFYARESEAGGSRRTSRRSIGPSPCWRRGSCWSPAPSPGCCRWVPS